MLAKINVDEEKFIAAQFQIQSIPTVYAMFQGQPVADLTNYRTEGQLKRDARPVARRSLPVRARRRTRGPDRAADRDGRAGARRGRRARAPQRSSRRSARWPRTIRRSVGADPRADRRRQDRRGPDAARCAAAKRRRMPRSRRPAPRWTSPRRRRPTSRPRKRGSPPIPTIMRRASPSPRRAWPPATATRPPTRCWRSSRRDREWNEGAAGQALLQMFEAAGSRTRGLGAAPPAVAAAVQMMATANAAARIPIFPLAGAILFPARAAAAAYLRAALPRRWSGRARRRRAHRDDPAAAARASRRRSSRSAASARSSTSRRSTTGATTSCLTDRAASG